MTEENKNFKYVNNKGKFSYDLPSGIKLTKRQEVNKKFRENVQKSKPVRKDDNRPKIDTADVPVAKHINGKKLIKRIKK